MRQEIGKWGLGGMVKDREKIRQHLEWEKSIRPTCAHEKKWVCSRGGVYCYRCNKFMEMKERDEIWLKY